MFEDKVVQLSEIEDSGDIELGRGNVISTGDLSSDPGGYPVYSSSAVGSGEFGRYGKYMFDEPLITWSVDGGGRPFLRKKHRFSVTNVCGYLRIRDPRKWDYGYLHAAILKAHEKIQFDYQAKAHPSVIRELYHLRWVPITEQRLIAHILDTLDTQIQKTEALIAKLEKVKEGLLHDLLTRGIDEKGRLRPSPKQASELYKESPLGLIPREWVPSSGAQACKEIVVGIVIKPTQYYRASGVPILRSANVRENRLSLDNLMYMSQQDHKAMSKSSVNPGDVLTVRTGYPGTSCVVDGSLEEANCVDIIISRVGEGLDPNFWALWINSDFGKGHVLKSQGGLAQQHFNVGDLKKIQLPIPAMPEQLKIVGTWGALQEQIQKESTRLEKLQLQKTGLMDDLLTGRVRVTPLLDQAQATTTPA